MLNQLMNSEGSFAARLSQAQNAQPSSQAPDLSQWMQYWNDADSVAGNLRRLEHWLQRARPQVS